MWWKLDRTYQVPAVYAGVRIDTSLPMKTAKDQAMINLLKAYLTDQLDEELNSASESGYEYMLSANTKSLDLVAYGWSEQFERFFNHALHALNPHDEP
jgi:secreted Zn-dependent insulinase-like peptidase